MGFVAGGCSPPEAASPADDLLRVSIPAAPVDFDPRIGTDEQSQRVHQLLFDPLLRIDADGRVVPRLADHLEHPDPLTCVVYLRSGIWFHDGHELTARDVVYTFASLMAPEFVSPRQDDYEVVESVIALDERRVQFTLREPSEAFPAALVVPIVPDGATTESLRQFPIGTGPYRFVRYAAGDRIELSTYETYWDGLPLNAGIILRMVSGQAVSPPADFSRLWNVRKTPGDQGFDRPGM